MGIFSRLGDIISSNVSDLLDRAEDPAKMIRMIILEMEETLIEVRASAARTIADQKDARRTLARLEAAQTSWGEKAELALSKGREDLAKAALVERQKMAQSAEQLRSEVEALDSALDKHDADIAKLEAKLREARVRQTSLVGRIETLENRSRMRRMTSGNKVEEAFQRFEMMEKRVDLAEGRVEAFELGQTKTLEDEFTALKASDDIEAELAALRQKVAGNGA